MAHISFQIISSFGPYMAHIIGLVRNLQLDLLTDTTLHVFLLELSNFVPVFKL